MKKLIVAIFFIVASKYSYCQNLSRWDTAKVDIGGRMNPENLNPIIQEKSNSMDATINSIDTLGYGKAIEITREGIDKIRRNLAYAHKEYKTGTYLFAIGTVGTIAGILVTPIYKVRRDTTNITNSSGTVIGYNVNTSSEPNYIVKNILGVVGGVMQLIGGILWIDSHKYIGRAGGWHFAGDKIVYTF